MENNIWPKISIITPSLNQAKYLEACIDSILSQNYPNLEYIIMDGGSTDGSPEIIRKYSKYLTYWQSQKDDGHYSALQEGFKKSSGEIMGWLNADDILYPGGLETLGNVFAKRQDIDFVTGKRVYMIGEKQILDEFALQRWSRDMFLQKENWLQPAICIMQEATYWRRSLWDRCGSKLDTSFKLAADFELWSRFLRETKLYTLDTTIGGFRFWGDEQRSQKERENYISEVYKVIERENNLNLKKDFYSELTPLLHYPECKTDNELGNIKKRVPKQFSRNYSVPRRTDYPKISIVTPSLNNAEYLEECIDSVLSQMWPNLDYIIIDQGSTDNSVEIIKKYEKYLSFWNVENTNNKFSALNSGFRQSTGEIMAWIEPADKYFTNTFVHVAHIFHKNPDVEWISGRPFSWDQDGQISSVMTDAPCYSRRQFMERKFNNPYVQQQSIFWKRPLWDMAGSNLNTNYCQAGDFDLWIKFSRYETLYTVNTLFGGTRIIEDSTNSLYPQIWLREANLIVDEEEKNYPSAYKAEISIHNQILDI